MDAAAGFSQITPQRLVLIGGWTAGGLGDLAQRLADAGPTRPAQGELEIEAGGITALDSAGALVLQRLLLGLGSTRLLGLPARMRALLAVAAEQLALTAQLPVSADQPVGTLESLGRGVVDRGGAVGAELLALLSFVGECMLTLAHSIKQPERIRWRPILFNLRTAGVDALAIVGLMAFLLGVVVAYQGAGQLRQYGATIFVADLVGLAMLREFAPLITAIIIAGRSGSAYAAQIGSMVVSEEVDAMRTLGLAPLEVLVLPKLIALLVAMPLLTVFADVAGVLGGMLMASVKLDVTPTEFIERFSKAVSVTSYLIGIAKAPVFAAVIVLVGCFQGFRAKGGADSVGRQTTRAVVQSIFLVITADALFSVAFSALDL